MRGAWLGNWWVLHSTSTVTRGDQNLGAILLLSKGRQAHCKMTHYLDANVFLTRTMTSPVWVGFLLKKLLTNRRVLKSSKLSRKFSAFIDRVRIREANHDTQDWLYYLWTSLLPPHRTILFTFPCDSLQFLWERHWHPWARYSWMPLAILLSPTIGPPFPLREVRVHGLPRRSRLDNNRLPKITSVSPPSEEG